VARIHPRSCQPNSPGSHSLEHSCPIIRIAPVTCACRGSVASSGPCPKGAWRNTRLLSASPEPQRGASPWPLPPRPRAPQPQPHPHAAPPRAALHLVMQCHSRLRRTYAGAAVVVGVEASKSSAAGGGPGVPARPCVRPPSGPGAKTPTRAAPASPSVSPSASRNLLKASVGSRWVRQ